MQNKFYKNNIIEPSVELLPNIRISPFEKLSSSTKYVDRSHLQHLFGCEDLYLLPKGRTAIYEALRQYDLKKDDVVTIFTTSNNLYISSCVTKEIEKFCSWSRELTPNTKVIFVNHEFGYPYYNLIALKELGFPIIEDCAHTFFSQSEDIGRVGDFVVYSLPKAFPMQLGGVLRANVQPKYIIPTYQEVENYILSHLSNQIENIYEFKQRRLKNYEYLKSNLCVLGIEPFFHLASDVVPGVFLFRWAENIDYPKLKIFMQSQGVESSVFYGENAYFIPCHQNLSKSDLDYMIAMLNYFLNKSY